jgi:hypothetical protein
MPFLRCFNKCGCLKKKKDLRAALRAAIIDDLRQNFEPGKGEWPKIPRNEQDSDANPFHTTGYGINSFLDIMKRQIKMFIGISFIVLPTMAIYKYNSEQGVVGLKEFSYKTFFNTLSLGNMGGAQTICVTKRLEVDPKDKDQSINLKLTCPNGKKAFIVQGEDAFRAGIMAQGIE